MPESRASPPRDPLRFDFRALALRCHLPAAPAEATKESDQPLIIDSIGTAELTLRG